MPYLVPGRVVDVDALNHNIKWIFGSGTSDQKLIQ